MEYKPYQPPSNALQSNTSSASLQPSAVTSTKPAFSAPSSAFPATPKPATTTGGGTPTAFQFSQPSSSHNTTQSTASASTFNYSSSSSSTNSNQTVPAMTTAELTDLRKLVEDVCGIHLEADKQYLLETRLLKLLIEYDCQTYTQLVQLCRGAKQNELHPKLVDLMTTKETMWFRDEHPYETLKTHILPDLLKDRAATDTIRIWSAACSTGQEPYSIGMCVNELASSSAIYNDLANGQRLKIKGTDIASSAVMLSKMGRYDMVAMGRGISEVRKNKFFTQQGRAWVLKDEVKRIIEFEQANLQADLSALGLFDIIFMRNVAIYFSKEFKVQLYAKLAKQLKPNGYLIIGSTESLLGLETPFKLEMQGKTSFYRLKK
jgi:chemotaxis protein methyltransferase CheR